MGDFLDNKMQQHSRMTREIESTLSNLSSAIGSTSKRMITENEDDLGEGIDLEITLDNQEDDE